MIYRKIFNGKLFGLILLSSPMLVDASTYTWNSTSSSDLNVAGNWTPSGGPPGTSDDAEFDSAISGVVISPVTLSGAGFSVSTIDFVNEAGIFSFLINEGTLTLNGGGIGAAIPGSQTNATFTSRNIDNLSTLTNQIGFIGNPSTSGSAILIATNSGTTTNTTTSAAQISTMPAGGSNGSQIHSSTFLTVRDGASFTATNTGVNQFDVSNLAVASVGNTQLQFDNVFNGSNVEGITLSASNSGTNGGNGNTNAIGYVGNPQINVQQSFFAGNNLKINTSNIGEEDSTGTGSDNVAYVGDNQVELDGAVTIQDNATIQMSNIGTITSNVTGNNNQVGLISGNQLEFDGALFAGNSLTFSATNTGTNNGSGSGTSGPSNINATGVIQGAQYYFGSSFTSGASTDLTATNTGTNTGSGSYNQTGLIQYYGQVSVASAFKTGSNATMTVSNTGTNSGSGTNNIIGEIQAQQIAFGGTYSSGNSTTLTISNTGTDNGSGSANQVGYTPNQQMSVTGAFTSGNNTAITASNMGTFSNTGSGSNSVGYVGSDQLTFNGLVTVGDNATVTVSNSGSSSGAGVNNDANSIGFVNGSQISTIANFQSGNALNLTITNKGIDSSSGSTNAIGSMGSYQCSYEGSFIAGDNATITVSNTGSMSGSATSHTVGGCGSSQFVVSNNFQAGNSLIMNISNEGTDSTTGAVNNSIAYATGTQLLVGGTFTVGDDAQITVLNKGTNSNSAGTGFVGTLSSSQNQFECDLGFLAGKNLNLSVTNSAQGVASAGVVGSCTNQLLFQNTCTIDDGSMISASNEGFARVNGDQILFARGFAVTSGRATIQSSNSSSGTVTGRGILVEGSAGGDVNVILTNSSLNITSVASAFTIGELNGDSTSVVQSTPQLIINTDQGVSGVFAGTMISPTPSLVKTGAGTQTLSGANAFSFDTTVEEGTLVVNGSLSGDVLVSVDGTIKGTGTVGGLTVDGIIAPGNSIGTLHVATYTQNSGSTYDVEVNGNKQSDLIDVTGTATINGGTVVVSSVNGTYSFQSPYTIVEAASRVGAYTGVSAVSTMITPEITYDSEHVYLTLIADVASAADTFNERAVAKQLDGISSPNALQNILLSEIVSLPVSEAESALDSISGWQYTSLDFIAKSVNAQFITRLYDPIRCMVTSDQENCCCNPCLDVNSYCNDLTVWTEGGGTVAQVNGNGNSHTYTLKGWEATVGIQKTLLRNWTLGVAGSFEHDLIHYKHSGGSGQSNTWLAGLYSLYRPSHFYTFADFTYGYSFNQMNRSLQVGSLAYQGKSNPDVSQFTFYGELGVDWRAKAVLIQPFVGVEAGSFWRKQTKENNAGGWGLHVDDNSGSLALTRLGTHMTVGKPSGKAGSASLDLSWDKQWVHKDNKVTERFTSFGDDFTIKGTDLNSNSFYYALTYTKCLSKHLKINLKGEGNVCNHAYQFDGLAGVEYSW